MPDRAAGEDGRPRTLVVHHRSGIGDLVWHVPYIRAIARTSRGGRVALMARPSCRAGDLLAGEASIDDVIEYDYRPTRPGSGPGRHRGVRGLAQIVRELRRRRFDRVYVFSSRVRYGLLAWLAGIPYRAGFGFSRVERLALNAAPYIRPYAGEGNWVYAEATEFARVHGFVAGPVVPQIAVPDDLVAELARELQRLPRPLVAVAIGTSQPRKNWGVENFARLAQALAERGAGVVLLGGPAEAASAQRIRAGVARAQSISIRCESSVLKTAAALKACDVCVGNDTGALNLAPAVGVPALGLFGGTKPLQHDARMGAIEGETMNTIAVDDVLARLATFGV